MVDAACANEDISLKKQCGSLKILASGEKSLSEGHHTCWAVADPLSSPALFREKFSRVALVTSKIRVEPRKMAKAAVLGCMRGFEWGANCS